MTHDALKKLEQNFQAALNRTAELELTLIWISIGSNLFFEFGPLQPKNITGKSGHPDRIARRGLAALALHAYSWTINRNGEIIAESDNITSEYLPKLFDQLRGVRLQSINRAETGSIGIEFDRGVSVRIEFSLGEDSEDLVALYMSEDAFESIGLERIGERVALR